MPFGFVFKRRISLAYVLRTMFVALMLLIIWHWNVFWTCSIFIKLRLISDQFNRILFNIGKKWFWISLSSLFQIWIYLKLRSVVFQLLRCPLGCAAVIWSIILSRNMLLWLLRFIARNKHTYFLNALFYHTITKDVLFIPRNFKVFLVHRLDNLTTWSNSLQVFPWNVDIFLVLLIEMLLMFIRL